MSTSYQDISVRLGVMERKLQFLMDNIPVTVQTRSPFALDEVVNIRTTFTELYKQASTGVVELIEATDASTE